MHDTPRELFDLVIVRLRAWAAASFPQAWELQTVSDEPTRFLPVRMSENSTADEIVVLVNGFPSSLRGTQYVQLQATLTPSSMPEWPAFDVRWDVVTDDGARVLTNLITVFVENAPGEGVRDTAKWFLEQLVSACEVTNRKVLPMQPTKRPT